MKQHKKYHGQNLSDTYSSHGDSINKFEHLDEEVLVTTQAVNPLTISAYNSQNPELYETPFQNVPDFESVSKSDTTA